MRVGFPAGSIRPQGDDETYNTVRPMTGSMTTPGWVYVLTNPSMPGLVKIGFTSRDPSKRAAELAQATGVPTPFAIAWCRAVVDSPGIEATVHRMLDDRRVSGREFFRCDVKTARQVIEAAAGGKIGQRYRQPRLQQQRVRHRARRPRWRRGGDSLPTALVLAGIAVIVLVAVFRPPLPSWLPHSVVESFGAIERLHG